MGWNELRACARDASAARRARAGDHAYFVHSYHFQLGDQADLLAITDYGGPLAAVVGRDNLVGTQFHPEKSQAAGLRLIANFLALAAMSDMRSAAGQRVTVERLTQYSGTDLDDLCEATEARSSRAAGSAGSSRRRARCWRIIGRACCWSPSGGSSSAGSTA